MPRPQQVALVYGFINAATEGWGNGATVASLVTGGVLLAVFLAVELRTAQPLLPLHLFADRNRAAAYVFCLGPMAGMSMFFFLSQYLQDVRGMNALATGFAFLPVALLVFAMSRLIPHVLPRFGPQPTALAGAALMTVGLVLLTGLDRERLLPAVARGLRADGTQDGTGLLPAQRDHHGDRAAA